MSILDSIVEAKRRRVARGLDPGPKLAGVCRPDILLTRFRGLDAGQDQGSPGAKFRVVAEVKKASPSGGVFRPVYDPASIARQYQSAGAFAISVLTEEEFFQGSLNDLRSVREAVNLPILRKDFIIALEQIEESRAAGADMVLLIVACLEDAELKSLISAAERLELLPLVEVHDESEAERALKAGARLLGINNRNLKTLQVSLQTGLRVSRFVRSIAGTDVAIVGESGIRSQSDMEQLSGAGCQAFLIGETLLRSESPGAALKELLRGQERQEAYPASGLPAGPHASSTEAER